MKSLNKVTEELGHSQRFVEVTTPYPTIYATLYWGNQKNKGGISECFTMPFNEEKGCWENVKAMARIFHPDHPELGGRFECGRTFEDGMVFGLYCSPNETDVKLFMTAWVSAMSYILQPEPQQNHGV